MADVGGDGGEAPGQRGKIQTAVVLMDLDGIATAHGHVGLSLAIKMEEFAADTDGALGISFHADCAIIPGPDIEGNKASGSRWRGILGRANKNPNT